ncbi:MAG: alpha/beta hydrolase [Clostridia bacterium]|nr:alpha/beta hydrolase [Clostridia bacterium]
MRRRATVDLSEVSFLQTGKGKDLVFMHGYLSSKEAFSAQIRYFSKFYKVTAFDFLGFGGSGILTKPYSVDDYADWTDEVLSLLGVRNPHLIAHSFGCRVALKLSSRKADFFDKMLLTGAAGIILNRGLSYRCKVKAYRLVKKFAPKFAERRFGSVEYRALSPIMKESYKKIVNEDLRGCAKKTENEVLLVTGKGDTVTPIREAETYLACLKRGRLCMIDGGHFAFAEYPTKFNLIAEEFFYE